MKATLTKDASTSHSSKPFFNKKGEGSFFSPTIESEEPFFSPATIQPKLTIGQPNDKYEQEADEMAEKVSRMPMDNGIQTKCDTCGDEEENTASIQTKPSIQRTELEEEEALQTKPLIQKEETEEEEDNLQIQKMEDESASVKTSSDEEEELQTKPLMMRAENGKSVATPELSRQLNSTKSKGSSLPDSTANFMSRAFGHDFSRVRVHTDSEAVQMNQDLNAKAFTHGSDIYFNQGQYNPGSSEGKKMLGHELTHVVQQGGSNRKENSVGQTLMVKERNKHRGFINRRIPFLNRRIPFPPKGGYAKQNKLVSKLRFLLLDWRGIALNAIKAFGINQLSKAIARNSVDPKTFRRSLVSNVVWATTAFLPSHWLLPFFNAIVSSLRSIPLTPSSSSNQSKTSAIVSIMDKTILLFYKKLFHEAPKIASKVLRSVYGLISLKTALKRSIAKIFKKGLYEIKSTGLSLKPIAIHNLYLRTCKELLTVYELFRTKFKYKSSVVSGSGAAIRTGSRKYSKAAYIGGRLAIITIIQGGLFTIYGKFAGPDQTTYKLRYIKDKSVQKIVLRLHQKLWKTAPVSYPNETDAKYQLFKESLTI